MALFGSGEAGKSTILAGTTKAGMTWNREKGDGVAFGPALDSSDDALNVMYALDRYEYPRKTSPNTANHAAFDYTKKGRPDRPKRLEIYDLAGQTQEVILRRVSTLKGENAIEELLEDIASDEQYRDLFECDIPIFVLDTHEILNGNPTARLQQYFFIQLAARYARTKNRRFPKSSYIIFAKFDWWLHNNSRGARPATVKVVANWHGLLRNLIEREAPQLIPAVRVLNWSSRLTILPVWVQPELVNGAVLTSSSPTQPLKPLKPLKFSEAEFMSLIEDWGCV
jgi:hypothetical protein